MLYEYVKKILDKSKETKVDLSVAKDMLGVGEIPEERKRLHNAFKILDGRYYSAITTLRRDGNEDKIKELCGYIEAKDKKSIDKILKELKI